MEDRLVLLRMDRPFPAEEEKLLFDCVDSEKRRQLARITHRQAQQEHLAGAVLVRLLAGEQVKTPPWELRLSATAAGKPFLPGHPDVHFNLSHTRGGILCGFSGRPVGVDIEALRPVSGRVAARWFSPAEQGWAGQDPARLLTLWTRKEAAAKWAGRGLLSFGAKDTLSGEWLSRIVSGQRGEFVWSACGSRFCPAVIVCWQWEYFMDRVHFAAHALPGDKE